MGKKSLNILLTINILLYIIGYTDAKKVRLLCVMLPKMSAYRRDFDQTKYMYFLIKSDELLEKYNEIWDKVSNSIKQGFDSEHVHNEKYIKIKIKFYERKVGTKRRFSVHLIDSVFRVGKNYYPQVSLEKCKYVVKEKKMPKHIIEDIEISFDDSDKENSDIESSQENFDEENSDEENRILESKTPELVKESFKDTIYKHISQKTVFCLETFVIKFSRLGS